MDRFYCVWVQQHIFYLYLLHTTGCWAIFHNILNFAQFRLLSIADINYPIFWKKIIFFTVVIGTIFFCPLRNNCSIWQYLFCPMYQEFQLKSKIISCDNSFIHTILTHFLIFEKKNHNDKHIFVREKKSEEEI